MTTVDVSEETHKTLKTLRANLTGVRGKSQSMNDVIEYLIDRERGLKPPEVEMEK